MASRYSNFPVSLYQDRSWVDQVFFSMNVNCHSTLWCLQYPWVCTCVCFGPGEIRVCRAVELFTSNSLRPFKLSSNHCVLLSGLPQWQTLWKPEQALLRRGLTECFSDRRECFLKIGKYRASTAILKPSLQHNLYMLVLSHHVGSLLRETSWWSVIDTVIFHREMKIQTRKF